MNRVEEIRKAMCKVETLPRKYNQPFREKPLPVPADTAPKVNVSQYDKLIRRVWEEYGMKAVKPQDERFTQETMDMFNAEWNSAHGVKA